MPFQLSCPGWSAKAAVRGGKWEDTGTVFLDYIVLRSLETANPNENVTSDTLPLFVLL